MHNILEGERIILRKAKLEDINDIHEIWKNKNIADKMLWETCNNLEESLDRLNSTIEYQKDNYAYFVELKEESKVIGFAGIREEETNTYSESGIAINEKYQAKGYGKEVLDILLDLVFNKLNASKFIYTCFQDNYNSKKICTNRNFKYLDTINKIREHDNKYLTIDRYYLDKNEYEINKNLLESLKNDNYKYVWDSNLSNDLNKLSNKIYVYDNWLEKYLYYIDNSKEEIVDLGCGIGNDTLYLLNKGKKVLSVDYSKTALNFIDNNIIGSKTLEMDINSKWKLSENSRDLIIANLSLHYFDSNSTIKIIDNIIKTLINKGILIVRLNSINDINYGANSMKIIEKNYYEAIGIRKRFFDKEDIEFYFSKMKILSCKEVIVNTDIHTNKHIWEVVLENNK